MKKRDQADHADLVFLWVNVYKKETYSGIFLVKS